eukprot:661763-Pelagomonas_calceolata.AAC.7
MNGDKGRYTWQFCMKESEDNVLQVRQRHFLRHLRPNLVPNEVLFSILSGQVWGPRRGCACSWGLVKAGSCQGYGFNCHCMASPSNISSFISEKEIYFLTSSHLALHPGPSPAQTEYAELLRVQITVPHTQILLAVPGKFLPEPGGLSSYVSLLLVIQLRAKQLRTRGP